MNAEYLFVYGTLLRNEASEMHSLIADHAVFVDVATYNGILYRIDHYPGAVPSTDPVRKVHGEVYSIDDPGVVFPVLDAYEECGPNFPRPNEFIRQKQSVILSDGRVLQTWIYIYNHSTETLPEIPSGDFLGE